MVSLTLAWAFVSSFQSLGCLLIGYVLVSDYLCGQHIHDQDGCRDWIHFFTGRTCSFTLQVAGYIPVFTLLRIIYAPVLSFLFHHAAIVLLGLRLNTFHYRLDVVLRTSLCKFHSILQQLYLFSAFGYIILLLSSVKIVSEVPFNTISGFSRWYRL